MRLQEKFIAAGSAAFVHSPQPVNKPQEIALSYGARVSRKVVYIYLPTANGPMPIAAVINGNLYAVHSDHLNTPRRLTNNQGQAVWQWAYSAFGDEEPTTAKNRFANLSITPNPGTTSISDVVYNVGYPGQYRDKETGLSQNQHRYYDERTGRYTQFDPIGLRAGPNGYAYVNGNPLSYVDPSGLILETLWDAGNLAYDVWKGNWEDAAWDAAAMCIPGVPAGLTKLKNTNKIFSKDKQALVEMAKKDKKNGITPADMQAYKDLNKQLPDPFPTNKVRGPEAHVRCSAIPGASRPRGTDRPLPIILP